MRLLGYFMGACVALALLQAAVKLIVLLLILGAFATFISRPRETIALVTTLGVLNLVALYPLPALGLAGALAVWRLRRGRAEGQLPPDERALDSPAPRLSGRR